MYFPWDCVAVDEGASPFSKDIEALKTGSITQDRELLQKLMAYIESKRFMKQSYDGEFSSINKCGLGLRDVLGQMGFTTYSRARREAQDYAVMELNGHLWNFDKQIYQIDADFADELLALNDRSDEIAMPVSLLKGLPYKNFYIDFSECKSEKLQPFVGVFVTLSWEDEEDIPTFTFIAVQMNEKPQDKFDNSVMYHERFTPDVWRKETSCLVTKRGDETILHLKPEGFPEFVKSVIQRADHDVGVVLASRSYFMFVLQVILYLASDKPDVVVTSKPHKRDEGSTHHASRVAKKPNIASVGVTYGTSIRSFKKRYVSNSASSMPSNDSTARKRPIAHMRRAHWHLFWTGPGRKVPKVRWVSAFQAGGHVESKNAVVHVVKK